MKDGNSTIKGNRVIISVAIPKELYDTLNKLELWIDNRSAFITRAITRYALGMEEINHGQEGN